MPCHGLCCNSSRNSPRLREHRLVQEPRVPLLGDDRGVTERGAISFPMKQGRIAMTDVRDIVGVAAQLLPNGGHEGRTYTLTTLESFTFAEFAAALGTGLNKPVQYVDIPISAARESMVAMGMDPWIVDGYMELLEGLADDWGDKTPNDTKTILGRPARGHRQFIADLKDAFAGAAVSHS